MISASRGSSDPLPNAKRCRLPPCYIANCRFWRLSCHWEFTSPSRSAARSAAFATSPQGVFSRAVFRQVRAASSVRKLHRPRRSPLTWARALERSVDSIYLGGGTPSVFGSRSTGAHISRGSRPFRCHCERRNNRRMRAWHHRTRTFWTRCSAAASIASAWACSPLSTRRVPRSAVCTLALSRSMTLRASALPESATSAST